VKYAWIKTNKDSFPIAVMCRVLGVSKSGYYKSIDQVPSIRAQRTDRIRSAVKQVHLDSNQIYGSHKIAKQLKQTPGLETACRNTVAKAMREMGLKSCVSKKFTPTTTQTDPSKTPAPNVLNQVFAAEEPNKKWVTDITYLSTAAGWVYLAVVLDLFSRKVIGWSISESLSTPLVSVALRNAIESRSPVPGELLHHSDRGCQYTSHDYQKTLTTLGITCSMSRRGCCYDNAVMERFFWSLKQGWTNHESFADIDEARLSVFRYIETFYNSRRLHQSLGYQSPNDFEAGKQVSLTSACR
jgi:putative transposase